MKKLSLVILSSFLIASADDFHEELNPLFNELERLHAPAPEWIKFIPKNAQEELTHLMEKHNGNNHAIVLTIFEKAGIKNPEIIAKVIDTIKDYENCKELKAHMITMLENATETLHVIRQADFVALHKRYTADDDVPALMKVWIERIKNTPCSE